MELSSLLRCGRKSLKGLVFRFCILRFDIPRPTRVSGSCGSWEGFLGRFAQIDILVGLNMIHLFRNAWIVSLIGVLESLHTLFIIIIIREVKSLSSFHLFHLIRSIGHYNSMRLRRVLTELLLIGVITLANKKKKFSDLGFWLWFSEGFLDAEHDAVVRF